MRSATYSAHQHRRGQGDAVGQPGCTPGPLGAAIAGRARPRRSPATRSLALARRGPQATRRATARPNSSVEAVPPRSRVRIPSRTMVSIDGPPDPLGPVQLAQVVEHHRGGEHLGGGIGDALARRCPARCRAPPRRSRPWCRCWRPARAPARRPGPETSSLRMSPNMLVVTMTSNCSGRITSCIAVLSTIMSLDSDPALVLLGDRAAHLEEEPAHHLEDVRLVHDGDLAAGRACRAYSKA